MIVAVTAPTPTTAPPPNVMPPMSPTGIVVAGVPAWAQAGANSAPPAGMGRLDDVMKPAAKSWSNGRANNLSQLPADDAPPRAIGLSLKVRDDKA